MLDTASCTVDSSIKLTTLELFLFRCWSEIFSTLSRYVKGMWLPAALFGVQPFPLTLSPAKRDFTAFTTLPARRLMLLKWKYPVPPTNTNWVKEVLYFLKLEQIRLDLIGDAVSLERSWNLFLSDVNSWDVWSLCSLPTYIVVLLYWSLFIKLFLYFVYSFISLFTCLSIYSFSLFYQPKFCLFFFAL